MKRFCPKCGSEVSATGKFCGKCGAVLPTASTVSKAGAENELKRANWKAAGMQPSGTDEKSNSPFIIGAVIAAVIALAGGGIYHFYGNDTAKEVSTAKTASSMQTKDAANSAQKDTRMIKQAEELLQNRSYDKNDVGDVLAVSQIDDNGFFALAGSGDNKRQFILFDKTDNIAAVVKYDAALLNPQENSNDKDKALVFEMKVLNDDKNSKDSAIGYWNGSTHIIPVKVYTKMKGGILTPIGIYSHKGKDTADFSAVLYEQQNVNLVNAVLLHADSLRKDMQDRKLDI